MLLIDLKQAKFLILTVASVILLLPLNLEAQNAGKELTVSVNHRSIGDDRNIKIEDILNRTAVLELEQSGFKGVVSQDIPGKFSHELEITGLYIQQQDMIKIEYQLHEAASGKLIAEVRMTASLSLFLDRAVSLAVNELLHKNRDEINRIALTRQEVETSAVSERTDRETETEDKFEPERTELKEQRPRRVKAEVKISGSNILGQISEYFPYGLLIEGRISYPVVQREKMAWLLGASLGVIRFSSADNYKANYVKTLVPIGLLAELRLKKAILNKKSDWIFRFWWTAGAALRPPYEDEVVNKLLAPAFPYTHIGIGAQVPLGSDWLWLSAGFSGMGLLHLYEDSDGGDVRMEAMLGINCDLGIAWRM